MQNKLLGVPNLIKYQSKFVFNIKQIRLKIILGNFNLKFKS